MKKVLSYLLVFILLLSPMLLPVHAHAEEATPYAFICPGCDERLMYQTYQYDDVRNVSSCAESIKPHTHTDRIFESVYFCVNNDCGLIGFETNRRISVLYTTCDA